MNQLMLIPATLDDVGSIVMYDQESNATPWTYNDYVASYNNSQHHILLLMDVGIIKGVLTYSMVRDEIEILQLFVVKSYQAQGYGQALLELFINQICMPNKINQILLEVRADNQLAKKLYDKLGFIEAYTRKNYYKCGNKLVDAQVMLKTVYAHSI